MTNVTTPKTLATMSDLEICELVKGIIEKDVETFDMIEIWHKWYYIYNNLVMRQIVTIDNEGYESYGIERRLRTALTTIEENNAPTPRYKIGDTVKREIMDKDCNAIAVKHTYTVTEVVRGMCIGYKSYMPYKYRIERTNIVRVLAHELDLTIASEDETLSI